MADDDGDDRYDEYKDAVAMGYINPDGTQHRREDVGVAIIGGAGLRHRYAR